jgi:hypothetical protein
LHSVRLDAALGIPAGERELLQPDLSQRRRPFLSRRGSFARESFLVALLGLRSQRQIAASTKSAVDVLD